MLNDKLNEITNLTAGFVESEGVNKPRLTSSLKPVTVDEGKITQVEEDTDEWYDYYTKKWANAESNDGSLWVWIPRFAYKLDSESETIDIVFLKGTSDEPASKLSNGKNSEGITIKRIQNLEEEEPDSTYIVHPAFCNGSSTNYANGEWDKDISGFWMAKFEAAYPEKTNGQASELKYSKIGTSPSNKNYYYGDEELSIEKDIVFPLFKPNRPSYDCICIDDVFGLCQNMNDNGNPYGFTSIVDTHLAKNSEWGAVAYLSWDKTVGIGKEMNINNIRGAGKDNVWGITGYGAEGTDTTVNNIDNVEEYITDTGTEAVKYGWKSASGQKASTTGNITGVYDMNGGLWEFVAAYEKSVNGLSENGNTNFYGGTNGKVSDKYRTKYENEYANLQVKGDGVKETSTSGEHSSSWPNYSPSYSIWRDKSTPFLFRRREL